MNVDIVTQTFFFFLIELSTKDRATTQFILKSSKATLFLRGIDIRPEKGVGGLEEADPKSHFSTSQNGRYHEPPFLSEVVLLFPLALKFSGRFYAHKKKHFV